MLVNVPLTDQLQPATNDGQPSENATADCVPASCDAAAKGLGCALDKTPDWWKDSAYGQGYTGATDPMHFAGVFAGVGLSLTQVDASQGMQLVSLIRDHLAERLPILGAIPSQWGLDYSGLDMVHFGASTHEVCFCDDTGASLTAMNPWHGIYQTQPYQWWADRLVYGRVNPVWEVAMAWVRQADGSGRDGRGHACGAGSMNFLTSNALEQMDGLLSETFYTSDRAFLPLAGGPCIRVMKNANGSWTIDQQAGSVAADLWGMVEQLRSAPAPTPPPPPAPVTAATPVQVAGGILLMDLIAGIHAAAGTPA